MQDASRLWKTLHGFLTLVKPLLCRLQVEGQEHIPATGGCIVASTHTLGPDYVILGYASSRQLYYMAKSESFQIHPLVSKLLHEVGTFPIERGQSDLGAMHAAEEVVRQGHVLGMFPEGTRSRDGQLGKGRTGVARIALATNAPVVPAAVINAGAIFSALGHRPKVVVRFGPPVYMDSNLTAKANTDQIMSGIAALLPPPQRGYYGEPQLTTKPHGTHVEREVTERAQTST